jgi:uncharacterized membrane protein YdbT with pleckstrin-like domain
MSYADSLLANGEQVLYRARQHWLAPLAEARNGLLLFLAGLVLGLVNLMSLHFKDFLGQAWGLIVLVLLVVGAAWVAFVCLRWRAEEYIITNRRVLKVEGLIDKKSGDSSLEKINDAVLRQGIFGRLFGFGDLEILTANEDAIDRYHMLAHVVAFKKAMLNAKNTLDDSQRGTAPAAAPARATQAAPAPVAATGQPMTSDEVTATLAKLADLRDRGAITSAEYEAKKADLLGRL